MSAPDSTLPTGSAEFAPAFRSVEHRLAQLAVLGAVGLALVGAVAWGLGQWSAAAFGASYVPMAPITAWLLIALGLTLGARLCWWEAMIFRRLAISVALVAMLAGGLVLAQSFVFFSLPWEGWQTGAGEQVRGIPVGRMSSLTAIGFLSTAISVLGLGGWSGRFALARWLTAVAAGLGALLGLVVALGYASGTPLLYDGKSVPMALLTALSLGALNLGLLLAGPAGVTLAAWRTRAPAATLAAADRIFRARLIAVACALAVLVALSGFYRLRSQQTVAREAVYAELDAIAQLTAEQIRQWREERSGDARFLHRAPAVAADVAALVAEPDNRAIRARVLGWLEPIKGGERYESIRLFDAQLRLLLAVPPAAAGVVDDAREPFAIALARQEVVLDDLHPSAPGGLVCLDFLVPVLPPRAGFAPGIPAAKTSAPHSIAVILLRLNASQFLFPLLRRWPAASETGEMLLLRRETGEVLYLGERRSRLDAGPSVRRPATELALPASWRMRGELGVREDRDHRGVAVMAAVRAIPDSPWALVAKVDRSEAYAVIRRGAGETLALVLLRLLIIGLVAVLLWRQRNTAALHRALAAELDRNALAERLNLVSRYANDIVLICDEDLRILEANERAVAAYGRPVPELRQLTARDLRAAAAGAPAEYCETLTPEGAVFETVHRRADGSEFPVEVSARLVAINGRRHYLAIVRDITERKAQERQIVRQTQLYAALSQVNQAIVRHHDRDGLFHEVCRALVKSGRFPMAWIGWRNPATQAVEVAAHYGDASGYLGQIRVYADDRPEGRGPVGIAIRENRPAVNNDFLNDPCAQPWWAAAKRGGYRAVVALPVQLAGQPAGALAVYASEVGFFGAPELALLGEVAGDLSFALDLLAKEDARRQTDAKLRQSKALLKIASQNARLGGWAVDLTDHSLTWSEEVAAIHELPPGSAPRWSDALNFQAPEYRARMAEVFGACARDGTPFNEELEITTTTGRRVWVRTIGEAVRDSRGAIVRVQGAIQDVSQKKWAEEGMRTSLLEKESLLMEVHHRVKNNLQVIISMLRLEAGRSEHPHTKATMREMQSRIRSMALLHESLYRSGNFAQVDMVAYLRQLATQLFRAQAAGAGRVRLTCDFAPARLEIDQAVPCGLIVNELVTNALKHGFPGDRGGDVTIGLQPVAGGPQLCLRVADTGVGPPEDFEQRRRKSLGMQLVGDLARQLGGVLEMGAGPGAVFEVIFLPKQPVAAEGPTAQLPLAGILVEHAGVPS